MTPVDDIAAEYWSYRHATDRWWRLVDGDLSGLDDWGDESRQATDERRSTLLGYADRARTLAGDGSASDRATLSTIAVTAETMAIDLRWRNELQYPNPEIGVLSMLAGPLPRQPLQTADDGDAFLTRIRTMPDLLGQAAERLRLGADSGITPLRRHAVATVAKLDTWLASPVADDPLMRQPPPSNLEASAGRRWTESLGDAVAGPARDGLAAYRAALADVTVPAGRPDDLAGLLHLEGGAAHYERAVAAHTNLDVSAAAVHEVGLGQVDELAEEYRTICGPQFGTDDLATVFLRLREDESLRYHQPDRLVADATDMLARATAAAPDWFGVVPSSPCVIEATTVGALAYYNPPDEHGNRPGQFFFNVTDPTMWGPQVAATTFHEGVPGHHFQFASALENRQIRDLHRRLYVTAYGEGWGLYTERLADEMGLYRSDLERAGMLMADSMRACRLVVDTGMHALGWSRQQAIDYMVANTPLSPVLVAAEIDRYIANPGQALSYMMGRLEIQAIRNRAEQTLGPAFDIKAFHDVVLGSGAVSLEGLRGLVEAWMAA